MTRLNPYISFRGTAREAMEFYQSVFGGELDLSTFSDFQMPGIGEDEADLIMHGQLEAPGGLVLMGADTPRSMELAEGSSITISLSGDDDVELRGYWDKLAEGGTVSMPLEAAPWGDAFGQLTDRFGVSWMVNIAGSGGAAAETEDTAVSA
jgi:PhnB protein